MGGPVGRGGLPPYVYLQHAGPSWADPFIGPPLVDQVGGAQVGQVCLGGLCLWLQVDLQPYLYGGAAWWPPQWVGPAAGAQMGQVNWVACGYGCRWTSLAGWPVTIR